MVLLTLVALLCKITERGPVEFTAFITVCLDTTLRLPLIPLSLYEPFGHASGYPHNYSLFINYCMNTPAAFSGIKSFSCLPCVFFILQLSNSNPLLIWLSEFLTGEMMITQHHSCDSWLSCGYPPRESPSLGDNDRYLLGMLMWHHAFFTVILCDKFHFAEEQSEP